jgi:hypothetical protein
MNQYSFEIAKMNSSLNMSETMGMCMCYSLTFQKVVSL